MIFIEVVDGLDGDGLSCFVVSVAAVVLCVPASGMSKWTFDRESLNACEGLKAYSTVDFALFLSVAA